MESGLKLVLNFQVGENDFLWPKIKQISRATIHVNIGRFKRVQNIQCKDTLIIKQKKKYFDIILNTKVDIFLHKKTMVTA